MRKVNPPIENPILNLMDKRKKKLHFRYTNTDFINYDSFSQKYTIWNWIIGNFSWKKREVVFSYWKFSLNFSNYVKNFPTHYFLSIKLSIFPINDTLILPGQLIRKFRTRVGLPDPVPNPKQPTLSQNQTTRPLPKPKTPPMLKLEIRQENQTQSVTDLNDEEKLALFRVGRRRRPTQFQIFTGPGRDKSDHLFKQPIR